MDVNENNFEKYFLKPGFIYVTRIPTIISTILGSCISVCMYDYNKKYGGMNHYLFPKMRNIENQNSNYGDISIIELVRIFIDYGSEIDDLFATVIGGAHLEGIEESKLIAEDNIKICKEILNSKKIKIIGETTGGIKGRKVDFTTSDNIIKIQNLKDIDINKFYYKYDKD